MSSTNMADARKFEFLPAAAPVGTKAQGYRKHARDRRDISTIVQVAMFVIALIGIGLSGYLSWAALTSSKVAGCGSGQVFDCSHVLQSKWSTAFGIPVGVPAAALYLTVLASLVVDAVASNKQVKKVSRIVLAGCAFSAAFAAIWFICLQLFVVEHLCQYCLGAHACGLVLAALVVWNFSLGKSKTIILSALGFASVVVLATSQILAAPPKTYEIEHHAMPAVIETEQPGTEDLNNLFLAPGFDSDESTTLPDDQSLFEAPVSNSETNQGELSQRGSKSYPSRINQRLVGWLSSSTGMVTWSPQDAQQEQSNAADATADAATATADAQAKPQEEPVKKKEVRLVTINGGRSKLNAAHWPLVGQPNAEKILVEMFDYTCPHCRENHKSIKGAMDKLGKDKLAMVALCVPMNSNCNGSIRATDAKHAEACELARLAVAMWRVDPVAFQDYHEWAFVGDYAPSYSAALAKANSMVDQGKLAKELNGSVVRQYVAKQVQLYQLMGAGTVPKLLLPQSTVSGNVGSPDALIRIVNQQQ